MPIASMIRRQRFGENSLGVGIPERAAKPSAQDIEPAVASPAVMSRPTLVVSVVFVVLPEHSWKAGQESGSPDSADTSKQPGTFGTRGTERDNCPDGVSGCGTLISALSRLLSRPLSRRKA